VPFTPFLVVAGNRRILMDTGLGEFGGPTTGKLLENMRAAGFSPADIDTVLITPLPRRPHQRPAQQGRRVRVPKAKVMVPAPSTPSGWTTPAWLRRPPA
jgi:hypothetical protein